VAALRACIFSHPERILPISLRQLAPAQALPDEIFAYCDIVSPNETELETLTGRTIASTEDAIIAARDLINRFV
jgi:sugar/nucleoside kinase (ribokinase family)